MARATKGYAYGTEVAPEKTQAEIVTILKRRGATQHFFGEDQRGAVVGARRPPRRPVRLRAVLLGRVSTHKRSQDKSIPRQLAELGDMARRHGWQVVARVSDRVSGAELERPGLAEGLELIYRGDADILVVHELDRLGRDVAGMLATADKIRTVGGHFYVRDRNIDTSTSEGRLLFTMLAALAEFQRRSNVDKILSGLAHARKRGVRFGRPPTIPAEAVERALELRARRRGRPSWSAIAAELEAAKLGRIDRTSIASAVRRRLQGSAAPARAAARRAR